MKKIIIISLLLLLTSLVFIVSPTQAQTECKSDATAQRICQPKGNCVSPWKDIGQLNCSDPHLTMTCCERALSTSPSPSPSPGSGGGTSVSFGGLSPVGQDTSIPQIIGSVVKAVLSVVGALALFMVVYGGIILLSSAGKQDQIKKGKDVLIWATIGVAVVLGSYVLVDFIITGIEGGGGQ
ncbi:MAG: hypothetical protein GF365_01750 [Candidatus Buchananbacteria bacterium]|nr:hypothetical protein [Candidatus Buchananbacteria bacterium]